MAVSEAMITQWIADSAQAMEYVLPAMCAISVVMVAKMLTPKPVPVDELDTETDSRREP